MPLCLQDMTCKDLAEAARQHTLAACGQDEETLLFLCQAYMNVPRNSMLQHVNVNPESKFGPVRGDQKFSDDQHLKGCAPCKAPPCLPWCQVVAFIWALHVSKKIFMGNS